jgi:hypothetical protein
MQLFYVKSQLLSGNRLTADDLKPMEDAVAKIAARLEPCILSQANGVDGVARARGVAGNSDKSAERA